MRLSIILKSNGPGVMVTSEAGPGIILDQNFISGNQDAGIVFDTDGMYSNIVDDTPNIINNVVMMKSGNPTSAGTPMGIDFIAFTRV